MEKSTYYVSVQSRSVLTEQERVPMNGRSKQRRKRRIRFGLSWT